MKALPVYWTIFFITMIVWLFSDWKTALVVPLAFGFMVLAMFVGDFLSTIINDKGDDL